MPLYGPMPNGRVHPSAQRTQTDIVRRAAFGMSDSNAKELTYYGAGAPSATISRNRVVVAVATAGPAAK